MVKYEVHRQGLLSTFNMKNAKTFICCGKFIISKNMHACIFLTERMSDMFYFWYIRHTFTSSTWELFEVQTKPLLAGRCPLYQAPGISWQSTSVIDVVDSDHCAQSILIRLNPQYQLITSKANTPFNELVIPSATGFARLRCNDTRWTFARSTLRFLRFFSKYWLSYWIQYGSRVEPRRNMIVPTNIASNRDRRYANKQQSTSLLWTKQTNCANSSCEDLLLDWDELSAL